jgi:hypothetical protein
MADELPGLPLRHVFEKVSHHVFLVDLCGSRIFSCVASLNSLLKRFKK